MKSSIFSLFSELSVTKSMQNTYLTLKEAANILKTKNRAVMKLVNTGQLKAFRPSERKVYFTEEMIKNYVEGAKNDQ